jgi:Patatin-like phospholipase
MTSFPLSLADVLGEEFRYFFPDLTADDATIEAKDVRELGDLARKLPLLAQRKPQTRWRILYERARAFTAPAGGVEVTGDAVVKAFQSMLVPPPGSGTEDGWLLDRLLEDATVGPLIGTSEKLHELLQIRVARRLLLEHPQLAERILAEEGLMREFHLQSAAVRLLDAKGFRPGFERYPALLSIIGDDKDLNDALSTDPEALSRRDKLISAYAQQDEPGFFTRFLRKIGLRKKPPIDAQHELTPSATALKESFGLTPRTESGSDRVEGDAIPREALSHFNAILLEIGYSKHLAGGFRLRGLYDAVRDRDLAALCLSGGGIRSATFNLGVLQGLADHRLLTRFHYLSTVSGGGYIGSWLSSWIRRHPEGATGVAKDLSRVAIDPQNPEVEPIQHLRRYTSYLTPAAGALSVDTWTLVATYFRNLLLNWTILLPFLVSVFVVPRGIEAAAVMRLPGDWTYVMAAVAVLGMLGVAFARPASDITAKHYAQNDKALRKQRMRSMLWMPPLLVAAILFTIMWPEPNSMLRQGLLWQWIGGASAVSAFVYAIRRAFKNTPETGWRRLEALLGWTSFWKRALVESVAAAVAGAAAGWLLKSLFTLAFPSLNIMQLVPVALYVSFAPPLFLLCFFAEAALIVGFSTYLTSDHDREWWARSAALLFIAGVVHTVVALCVLILPQFFVDFPRIWAAAGGTTGIVTWVLKKVMNQRKKDDVAAAPGMLGLALKGAALATLLLVIAAVSLATSALINKLGGTTDTHLLLLTTTPLSWIAAIFVSAIVLSVVMSRLLNVNVYSMHRMYRNRLVRAYLGASRWNRNPDAFTGFDPEDDLSMWQLRPEALWRSSFVSIDEFIKLLPGQPWYGQLDEDLRDCIARCGATDDPDEREELKTAIVYGLDTIMLKHDLQHDVPAPCGTATLRLNREYLETCFPREILKRWKEPVPATGDSDELDEEDKKLGSAAAESEGLSERELAIQRMRARLFERAIEKETEPFARTPIHVANIALNLVGGDNLAWQERKADSFTVSPYHSGNHRIGYRESCEYGGDDGISLGDAMAISGAAVSPNMGYNSSPIVTFLMTLFNARLGWWLGNPGEAGKDTFKRDSPKSTLPYLVDEALGATTDSDAYVFLSDGGHFDNLGLYEMVLRRCKSIVVCDASADGHFGFGDLGNAVRKIRIDLGIPIELTTKHIKGEAGEAAGRYCAMGKILYPEVDGYLNQADYEKRCGRLLYIKPAVYGDCPPDVRNYRTEHTDFPHQSTVNQFFDESQFESYRALGRHAVGRLCRNRKEPQYGVPTWKAPNLQAFFFRAFNYIHDAKPSPGDQPISTMKNVVDWMHSGLSGDA